MNTSIVSDNQYLISAEELKAIKDKEIIKILDFRKENEYNKEHIVNSIQIWRNHIVDKNYPYKGMMASAEQIEKLFSRLGIKSTDLIIIYDNNGLCEAARLWWILQNYNFTNVKMLKGGLQNWKKKSGVISTKKTNFPETNFRLPKKKSMKYYISKTELVKQLNKVVLIDTRSKNEYLGKIKKNGAAKAGRIPNSFHIDWAENIHFNKDKSLKSIEQLEKIYNKLNIKKEDSIILYCHSGVRSAHTTFVLTQLLNFKNVKNYDGSWTEWSHFKDLPYLNESKIKL